jgi:hypothetical protein
MTNSFASADSGDSANGEPDGCSLKDLVTGLCDDQLTAEQFLRLEEILKNNPNARRRYLEHMLVDGLLGYEFGLTLDETPSPDKKLRRPEDFSRSMTDQSHRNAGSLLLRTGLWKRLLLMTLIVGCAMAGWFSWSVLSEPRLANPQRKTLPLSDPGFEWQPPFPGAFPQTGRWYGDPGEIVGKHLGISPLEGERMFRLIRSDLIPDDACDLYQLIDLQSIIDTETEDTLIVEASASFNSIPQMALGEATSFAVSLFAYSLDDVTDEQVPPRGRMAQLSPLSVTPLSVSRQQEPSDTDITTWQPVRTQLTIPRRATHLLVQVSAVRQSDPAIADSSEFAGHFVDQVALAVLTGQ